MNHSIIYCVRFILFLTRKEGKKKMFVEGMSAFWKFFQWHTGSIIGTMYLAWRQWQELRVRVSHLPCPCLVFLATVKKPQTVKYFRYSRQYLTFSNIFLHSLRVREKDGRNQESASCEARKSSHVVTFFVSYFVYKICPVFFLITWLTWFDASWRNKQDYPSYTSLFYFGLIAPPPHDNFC